MIPEILKISGFLSYRETVELDFTSFDLACISGANGAGKSTLLDAITWVLFGQARRKDDAIINSRSESAEIVLDFRYENDLYRIQRSKFRGKSNVLEFFMQNQNGDWKTLTEHSLRETEARVQNTLRLDFETFSNVSFFLQGKADQFAQQRAGDRKRILGNILGLETWDIYREKTSQTRRKIESELAIIESQLKDIHEELLQEDERKEHLARLQEDLKQLDQVHRAQESILGNIRQMQAALSEKRLLVTTLCEQYQNAQKRQQNSLEQLHKKQEEYQIYQERIQDEAHIQKAYEDYQQARTHLQKWDAIVNDFREYESQRSEPLMAIESEKVRLQQQINSFQEQQNQIHANEKQRDTLKNESDSAESELQRLTRSMGQQQEISQLLRTMQEEQSQANAENNQLRKEMNELKERIDRLNESNGVNCPLCDQPLSQEERLNLVEKLSVQGKEMGDRYRLNLNNLSLFSEKIKTIESELDESQKVETAFHQQQRLVDQLSDRMEQLSNSIQHWQQNQAPQMAECTRILEEEDFAHEARARLAEIDEHLKQLGYDAAAHDAARKKVQNSADIEEGLRLLHAARAAMAPLESVLQDLEKQIASDEEDIRRQETTYRRAEENLKQEEASLPDMEQAENELFTIQEKENRLRTEIGGAVQRVEVLKSLKIRQADLTQQKAEITLKIARLKMLERAFSNDGIPALLIEQALPEIEEQANKLLERLSGGDMTVRFLTQRDYKDKQRGDKKETLDILISDSAGTREYEMFSGGESFRINFAIRLALSRVLAQRAGARLQTLVIDEGFGNQDIEGRQRLLEAINLVKSDFAKILVITHIEELKDAFPARIEVEKNGAGSSLRVIA